MTSGKEKRGEEENRNDFAVWMRYQQQRPVPDLKVPAKMNCWECIFFAASEAQPQLIDYGSLRKLHESAATAGKEGYYQVLFDSLNIDEAIAFNPGLLLQPGDIVFFEGYGCEHVALATGNHENEDPEILSLWFSTNSEGSRLELTSIGNILARVKYKPSVVPCPF
jgi:cell wall-associated NlpC family hydrolase